MRADARAPRVPLHVSPPTYTLRPGPLPVNDSHDARSLPLRAPTPCKARAWSRDPPNERLSLGDSRNRHRLFLTKESEFAGDNQHLTVEETMQHTSGLSVL